MRRTASIVASALIFGVLGLAGAPAAQAQTAVCSAYAGTCVEPAEVRGVQVDRSPVEGRSSTTSSRSTPSTLPFSGGEVALLGLVGVGALAAGTVLVAATRRRGVTTA